MTIVEIERLRDRIAALDPTVNTTEVVEALKCLYFLIGHYATERSQTLSSCANVSTRTISDSLRLQHDERQLSFYETVEDILLQWLGLH